MTGPALGVTLKPRLWRTLKDWSNRVTVTSFDRRFDRWMEDPGFEAAYRHHRARVDAIDELMRTLDEARLRQGMTKATLARRIQAKPAAIRRLFSQAGPNPQIARVVDMAHELGLEIVVRPRRRTRRPTEAGAAGAA